MGVAKSTAKLKMPMVEPYEMQSNMSVNLKKCKGMADCEVGKKIAFQGMGVVRSMRKDQHEHVMSLDITKLEPMEDDEDEEATEA